MTPSDGTIRIPGYSHRLSTAIRPVSAAEVVGPNTGEKSRATEANSLMRKFSELCSRRTYQRLDRNGATTTSWAKLKLRRRTNSSARSLDGVGGSL